MLTGVGALLGEAVGEAAGTVFAADGAAGPEPDRTVVATVVDGGVGALEDEPADEPVGGTVDEPVDGEVSYGRSVTAGVRCADGTGDVVPRRGPAAPIQGRVPRSARAGVAVRRGGAMCGEAPEGSVLCAVAPWPEGHGTVFVVDAGTESATVRVC